jgi:cell division protein FtsB
MRKFTRFFRDVFAPALVACWVAYMAWGAVAGASGYRALAELRKEAAAKEEALADLTARRLTLSQRADLLNPHSLDPDMADERIRAVLGYALEGDLVLPRDELDRMLKAAQEAEPAG